MVPSMLLPSLSNRFRAFAERKAIPCVPGFVPEGDEHAPVVLFTMPGSNDAADAATSLSARAQAFVEILERADVAILVMMADPLSAGEWQEAVSAYESAMEELQQDDGSLADSAEWTERRDGARSDLAEALAEAKDARRGARDARRASDHSKSDGDTPLVGVQSMAGHHRRSRQAHRG